MIKIRQLLYLRQAIQTGSVTLAAQALNVAQTALGQQIRNLEDELGVRLLERHSRGVSPTPAGVEMSRRADGILRALDEAREAMDAFKAAEAVPLSLGLTPSIMRLVGDAILMELAGTIPGIALGIVEEFSVVLNRLLAGGELDCALTFAEPEPQFGRRALLEEELFYLTAPHLATDAATITFAEVIGGDLALTGRQDAVTQIVTRMARDMGLALTISYEVQSLRAVKNLVAKGIAATVMPYGAAEGELRSGVLRARLITDPALVRRLSCVWARERGAIVETPDFVRFVDAVADRLCQAEGPVIRRL